MSIVSPPLSSRLRGSSPRGHATPRQLEILGYIEAQIRERGLPPTQREIGEHFAITSTNGVSCHLKALVKKGLIRRVGRNLARGYVPMTFGPTCPCCGQALPREEPS